MTMSSQHSAVQKMAVLAGVDHFNTDLPPRALEKLEAAGITPTYYVWASPGITGEFGRLVNLGELIADRIIDGTLAIDVQKMMGDAGITVGSSSDGPATSIHLDPGIVIENEDDAHDREVAEELAESIAIQTKTQRTDWRLVPSDAEDCVIIVHEERKLVARAKFNSDGRARVNITHDPNLNIEDLMAHYKPKSPGSLQGDLDDERVNSIVEEAFQEIDNMGSTYTDREESLKDLVSCAFGYLEPELAAEIFVEVFDRPPTGLRDGRDPGDAGTGSGGQAPTAGE